VTQRDEETIVTPRQLSSDPYDGTTFTGDGTYYGTTSNGNCAIRSPIPSMYDGMIPGEIMTSKSLI